jgi:hypothetical protein
MRSAGQESEGSMRKMIDRDCERCGKRFEAVPSEVSRGNARFCSRQCGYRSQPKENFAGREFGYLTVLYEVEQRRFPSGRREREWYCECRCGTRKAILQQNFVSGAVHSCGCAPARVLRIGDNLTEREIRRRLRVVWASMKARCYCQEDYAYDRYGGRGITVCDAWLDSLESFRGWAISNGYQPGLSLDRIENGGPYSPDNCRWATRQVQANNKRNNRMLFAFGERKSLTDWVRDARCVVSEMALRTRISKGWQTERAIVAAHYQRREPA